MIMDRNAIKYLINIRNINRLYLTAKISKLKRFCMVILFITRLLTGSY